MPVIVKPLSDSDINLFTSKGDGNFLIERMARKVVVKDINLFTSKGDGNVTTWKASAIGSERYKPIYLERGRKRIGTSTTTNLFLDINLFTSKGDGNR